MARMSGPTESTSPDAPRAAAYQPWTLARLAAAVAGGEDFRFVLREFLDDVNAATDLAPLIEEPPAPSGRPEVDAFLGGLAEHLAAGHDVARPPWCTQPDRFLHRWWFVAENRAYDALVVRDSPAAFRRRGVFVHPSALVRV